MPRDGSGIYTQPAPDVVDGTTIESTVYNLFTHDVETDLNAERPIIAGGTGASSADEALSNLGAETAAQVVTNYDSHVWYPGSFRSAAGATGAPTANAFAGIAYIGEALAFPPTNLNVVVEARDLGDASIPGTVYVREKAAGVWGAWAIDAAGSFVAKAGDKMTGNLEIEKADPVLALDKLDDTQSVIVAGQSVGLNRWGLFLGDATAEAGANVGSDFVLKAHDDTGAFLFDVLRILRATGLATVKAAPTNPLGIATKGYVDAAIAAASAIPVGTYMLFVQAAAPTGWTKGVLWDHHALRVVTGGSGGASGGSSPFTTVFGKTATDATTITQSTMGVAPVGVLTSRLDTTLGSAIAGTNPWGKNGSYISNDYYVTAADNNEGLRVGGGSHVHAIDLRVLYVDVIPCFKA